MKTCYAFRRLSYLLVLLLLSGSQSACSPFNRVSDADQPSLSDYKITGFRYDIPVPAYSAPVSVTEKGGEDVSVNYDARNSVLGFKLQSFVSKIFPADGTSATTQSKAASDEANREFASIKLPDGDIAPVAAGTTLQSDFCARINNRLSSIDYHSCMAVKLAATGHNSAQGDPIMISRFAQLGGVAPTGRVLLIGGVHGDELSSVSIVFEWMEYLRVHHDGEFVWSVVPVMNPDGLFNPEPSRTNANGVDLNRNLPTSDWKNTALAYWRERASSAPRKFPGPSAGSEPETRWLIDEIDKFQPDMIVTVHAPYNLIDYDAPSRTNAPRRFGRLKGGLLGTYPGSLGNYAGVIRGIPVVTIELPSSNRAISATQAHDMWSDMLLWLEKTIPLENQRFLNQRYYANSARS